MRHDAKNVCHGAKNVRHGAKNMRHFTVNVGHDAENLSYSDKNVQHDAKIRGMVPKTCGMVPKEYGMVLKKCDMVPKMCGQVPPRSPILQTTPIPQPPNDQPNNTPNIEPVQIFNQGENLKSGVWQLQELEDTARYAVLLRAPAEAFGRGFLLPFGQKKSLLCCFGPFLAIFGVQ